MTNVPDPAERMAEVRRLLAVESAKLATVSANTDHDGHYHDPATSEEADR